MAWRGIATGKEVAGQSTARRETVCRWDGITWTADTQTGGRGGVKRRCLVSGGERVSWGIRKVPAQLPEPSRRYAGAEQEASVAVRREKRFRCAGRRVGGCEWVCMRKGSPLPKSHKPKNFDFLKGDYIRFVHIGFMCLHPRDAYRLNPKKTRPLKYKNPPTAQSAREGENFL